MCFNWAGKRKEEKQIIQRRKHLLENPTWRRKEKGITNLDSYYKEIKRVWEDWKGNRDIESWIQQAQQELENFSSIRKRSQQPKAI